MRTKDKLISNWKDLNNEIEIKTEKLDSLIEEIIICDSSDEASEEVQILEVCEKENLRAKTNNNKHLIKNSFLRGLLPHENDKSYASILDVPVVKRCCIEHCYFARNRSRSKRYNLRNLPANGGDSLMFQNENSNEQQTIDSASLASQNVDSVFTNNSISQNNVTFKKKRSQSSSSRSSNSSSSRSDSRYHSDTESIGADDSNDRDYCPEENSTDSEHESVGSGESCGSVKEIRKSDSTDSKFQNVSSIPKKSSQRLGLSNYPTTRIPSDFVSVHDLLSKIRNMQKLMKGKADKKFIKDQEKISRISSARLKKMLSRRREEDISKMSEYLFPVPHLTKKSNGEKNWRMEYTDEEIQSLGLDDLLLKASELNAENFTKALGRKLDSAKPNSNSKDGSEIVFTIPKPRRNSNDEEKKRSTPEHEFNKHSKTIKLDISKPFFESDKSKENEPSKDVPKLQEEVPSKRPGIKVKTVENINEEFKDFLGLKKNFFQDSGLINAKEDVSLVESQKTLRNSSISDKEIRSQEELEKGESGRPFIMTIIQSKVEKQRPAILRNSSSFKKKKSDSEKLTPTENSEEKMDTDDSKTKELNLPPSKSTESINGLNFNKTEGFNKSPLFGKTFPPFPKVLKESESDGTGTTADNRFSIKKRNIPFILNHNRKANQLELPSVENQATKPLPSSKLVKVNNENTEKVIEKTFKVTSIEQKLGPKETNKRFIKVVPYDPVKASKKLEIKNDSQQKISDDESDKSPQRDGKSNHVLSLTAFSNILKEILPDKWFLCLDKKYGLQIIKTHVDEQLNPAILISVVIARCGKLTVNVRGKQLQKTHELFSDLCNAGNSDNKLSLTYVLGILNKLRFLSVCYGCDDPSLKKYWSGDGFVEYHTDSQQIYRSHVCQLLVSLGKKRCYPCYRMNESFKKRYRKDRMEDKSKEDSGKDIQKEILEDLEESDESCKTRGVKRNLEDFLEESFLTMKQQIVDEIEKNKKLGEQENALKAQEEVLSFMGLTRKDSLSNPVRKSKRKKNSFYKLQQPVKKKIDQKELEYLEKYWTDINTLFSTSLLFGAYSRTGRSRLREKCRMFQKLLSTWRNIVKTNPEWIGGDISLPGDATDDGESSCKDSSDQFEKMDVTALRAYIINSVKEVNKIKHKLRTRNSYFKILYNKFVKKRIKRSKPSDYEEKKGNCSSANSTTNTPTPTDLSSDESSRDKEKITDDEILPISDLVMTCVSDAD